MSGKESHDRKKSRLPSVVGGFAASATATFLILSALDFGLALLFTGAPESPCSPFLRNWLLLIFKLLAGITGFSDPLLSVLNPLDVAVLILISLAGFAVALSLEKTRRVAAFIASLLPLAGIVVLAATGIAGRSSVMVAVPVLSACLFKPGFRNAIATIIGAAAGIFLLAGDVFLGAGPSVVIAVVFGIGYLGLIAWLALAAARLLGRAPFPRAARNPEKRKDDRRG